MKPESFLIQKGFIDAFDNFDREKIKNGTILVERTFYRQLNCQYFFIIKTLINNIYMNL